MVMTFLKSIESLPEGELKTKIFGILIDGSDPELENIDQIQSYLEKQFF